MDYQQLSDDYLLVEAALRYLQTHHSQQPSLSQIAASVGLSDYHFQRIFKRWVGISPKRFLQYLTKEHAKQLLDKSANLLEVSYKTGLSGPGRLHDLFISCEAVTPGEYKSHGEGLQITYGFHPSQFGECLIAMTFRGLCGLYFVKGNDRAAALDYLHQRWSYASLSENPDRTSGFLDQIFSIDITKDRPQINLFLHGTNFQIKVWEALIQIPPGSLASYQQIAQMVGRPEATRAVGNAVGDNPIAYLIPCHRVIRKMGAIGNYRWGPARKRAILGWEMAKSYP